MADLVSGHYPQSASIQALFGNAGNATTANVPIRSNLEWPVFSGPGVDTAGATVPGSGVFAAVPVPVDVGMVVSKISIFVGATGASTPTHSFGALYSGTTVAAPPLIGQSTDGGTAAIAASTQFSFTLTTPTVITAAMAPWGYIWAGFSETATTTVSSVITVPCGAAGVQYRWTTNSPLYFAQTAGSALGGTAAATLVNASTLTVAPVIALS